MITINIINDYKNNLDYNEDSIKSLFKNILIDYNHKSASISIILSNQKLLNKLKQQYFNVDQYTDVIAFNLEDKNEDIDGEVYVSIDDILENSIKYKTKFNDEFSRILIHGCLHLLGFDDTTELEKKEMTELENKYLSCLNKNIITL